MQTTAKLTDINIDFQTKKPKITFLLDNNEVGNLEELNGLKVDLAVKKWSKKKKLRCKCLLLGSMQQNCKRTL